MRITLPIYYTHKYKTKKDKTEMVGMNGYRNNHYQINNKIKKHYHKLVKEQLEGIAGIESKYRIRYKLYPKNKRSDMMNVISVIDKFLNDALQELAVVDNDNVENYIKCSCEVARIDRENPRIECEIVAVGK